MTISPDTKSWTWVLERACPDCGFDAQAMEPTTMGARVRAAGAEWVGILGGETVRERPRPDVWSPLEYACHIRDVFRTFDRRVGLMLETDGVSYPSWDQDATAVESRYAEQDPATVATELAAAGEALATRYDGVSGDQWQRAGSRSDGFTFTIASLARYCMHDVVHHVWDVTGRRA